MSLIDFIPHKFFEEISDQAIHQKRKIAYVFISMGIHILFCTEHICKDNICIQM